MSTHAPTESNPSEYLRTAAESLHAFMKIRNDSELDEATEAVLVAYGQVLYALKALAQKEAKKAGK